MKNNALIPASLISEQDFKDLFESAPGLYLVLTPNLTIVAVSDTYLRATMTQREDITGQNLFDVFPDNPNDPTATGVTNLRSSLNYVLQNRTAHTMAVQKYDIRRPDGSFEERYWSPVNKPVLGIGGAVKFIIHRVEDVTAQILAEKQNKENEERFELILDSLKDYAIFMISPDGRIATWNKGAETIKGYKDEEVIGRHISIFYTDDEIHKEEPRKNLETAAENGRLEIEGWRKRKDGSVFWADIIFTAVYTESGNLKGFVKVTRDITEQYKSKELIKELNATLERRVIERTNQLHESEKKYRTLFENNPMPMWVLDLSNFQFLDVNEAAIRHYGYSLEEFLSMTALDIRPEDERERFLKIQRSADSGPHSAGIWRHIKKDGTIIYVEASVDHITFEGKPARIVLSNDISLRKEAEEKLLKLNDELEDRVKVRTEQLEVANKELEAFSYSISHDLRAPLRAINGFTRILNQDYKDQFNEEGKRLFERITGNAKRMGQLIDDLLAFSRLGRAGISLSYLPMKSVVEQVIAELQQEKASHAVINVNSLNDVKSDLNMIRQVWVNLIGNAIKYSSTRAPGIIEIGSKQTGREITYYVRDNGIGFDMQYADKLFNVFQRLHGSDEFEGTGVGLAIVKRIVDKLGGRVWAEAKENEGATFYFTLHA